MAQEEKQLLLKDLLGRVLYGVKVDYHTNIFTLGYNLYLNNGDVAFENYPMLHFLENIEFLKPYLRPMSSMTEEEKKELSKKYVWNIYGGQIQIKYHSQGCWDNETECPTEEYIILFDYLNKHHFDYRGLISKGLALEAPEGMYK